MILLGSQLEGSHVLASQVTGWMLATQARRDAWARPAPSALRSLMSGPARAKSVMPAR